MHRKLSLTAAALICGLAAAAALSAAPVQLTFFCGHGDMEQGTKIVIAAYQKVHPNVTITDTYNSKDYETQFQSMLASNTLPDVALVIKQRIPEYAKLDLFMDLSNRPVAQRLFDVAKGPNMYEGKLYAVPFHLQGYGLLYNPDLFKKAGIAQAPRTLSELKAAVAKLKAAGITPFASQFKEQWACGQYLLFGISPMLAADPSLVADVNSGAKSFNNATFRSIFDYIDIMKNNAPPNPMDYAFGEGATYFGQQKAAMAVHGDWILQTALEANPDLKIKIVGIPYSENPKDPRVIVGVADGVGIVKSSPHLAEATDFFDYYTTVSSAQIVSKYNHAFAPQKGFDTSGLNGVYSDISKLIAAGQGVGWEWSKLNPVIVQEADKSVQAYLTGSLTRDQVLDNIEKTLSVAR